jgi:tetratricopeptide (TPR) repeat protein
MAIAYTKPGQIDQAIKCYRGALEREPRLAGAHYGLAFLLLKRGDVADAAYHLDAFLMDAPKSPEAMRWVTHARETLDALRTTGDPLADPATADQADLDGAAGDDPYASPDTDLR